MSFNSKYTGQQIEDLLDKVDKGSVSGGGYPVVTVTDDFNIDAQPNTFYNIKNSGEDSVNISIDPAKYSVEDKSKLTMFAWENWIEDLSVYGELLMFQILFGHNLKEDTSKEGYKYSSVQQITMREGDTITQITYNSYFSDKVKTGNNINWCISRIYIEAYSAETGELIGSDDYIETLGGEIVIPMTNLQVFTDETDDLAYVTLIETGYDAFPPNLPHGFIEVENDSSEYSHKYEIFGLGIMLGFTYCYTYEPIPNTTGIYDSADSSNADNLYDFAEIKFVKNVDIKGCEVANEYVFNIKSPANVTFNQSIKWNNGNEPDLSQAGTYTISLLNGVGCFTFVE